MLWSRTRIVCKASGSEIYNPSDYTAELANLCHFIALANSYPDDSFLQSRNMPIPFRHFEVKIEVVRVMHVEEVA